MKGSKLLKVLAYVFLFIALISLLMFLANMFMGGSGAAIKIPAFFFSFLFNTAVGAAFSAAASFMNAAQEHMDKSAAQDRNTKKQLEELVQIQKSILMTQRALFKQSGGNAGKSAGTSRKVKVTPE